MALLSDNSSVTVKKVCIGANRYSSQRGKAMYINCVDSYPDHEDSSGEFPIQFRCQYDEFALFANHKPSLLKPVVVIMEGQFVSFAGNQQFQPSKIISVAPFTSTTAKSGAEQVAQTNQK